MKKLVLSLLLALGMVQVTLAHEVYLSVKNFSSNNVKYFYNEKMQKCKPVNPGHADAITRDVRNGFTKIVEAYDSRAGELYILAVNRGDHFEEILTSSTFGACQLYLDTTIRKMDRVDVDYYIDLEYVN
jgi:hypothetical protein